MVEEVKAKQTNLGSEGSQTLLGVPGGVPPVVVPGVMFPEASMHELGLFDHGQRTALMEGVFGTVGAGARYASMYWMPPDNKTVRVQNVSFYILVDGGSTVAPFQAVELAITLAAKRASDGLLDAQMGANVNVATAPEFRPAVEDYWTNQQVIAYERSQYVAICDGCDFILQGKDAEAPSSRAAVEFIGFYAHLNMAAATDYRWKAQVTYREAPFGCTPVK